MNALFMICEEYPRNACAADRDRWLNSAPVTDSARRLTVVFDAVPVRGGTSLSPVLENLLAAWVALDTGDALHVVTGTDHRMRLPAEVIVHPITGSLGTARRMLAQSLDVPRVCRAVGADAMIAAIPSTTITPLPCPRIAIVHDQRYELRPEQFGRAARTIRTVSYGIGYRQADALVAISDRTRDDLLASRPYLRRSGIVSTIRHGADHVPAGTGRSGGQEYAIAFGQHSNKNVLLVLDAWRAMVADGAALPLRLCGTPSGEREALAAEIAARGLTELVSVLGWLGAEEFAEQFAGSSLVVFPSDFEGFGLPAVEAMRAGIPVVISPDPALVEVTGGHATTMTGWSAADLVTAVGVARATSAAERAAAAEHAATMTWEGAARAYRELVLTRARPRS
jgi:glycosyltransferase involved in cell wall biosynthesis